MAFAELSADLRLAPRDQFVMQTLMKVSIELRKAMALTMPWPATAHSAPFLRENGHLAITISRVLTSVSLHFTAKTGRPRDRGALGISKSYRNLCLRPQSRSCVRPAGM